jgi:hypothetical protein
MEPTLIIVLNDRETFESSEGPGCQALLIHNPARPKNPTRAYDLGAFLEDHRDDIQSPRYEIPLVKAVKNIDEINEVLDIHIEPAA